MKLDSENKAYVCECLKCRRRYAPNVYFADDQRMQLSDCCYCGASAFDQRLIEIPIPEKGVKFYEFSPRES